MRTNGGTLPRPTGGAAGVTAFHPCTIAALRRLSALCPAKQDAFFFRDRSRLFKTCPVQHTPGRHIVWDGRIPGIMWHAPPCGACGWGCERVWRGSDSERAGAAQRGFLRLLAARTELPGAVKVLPPLESKPQILWTGVSLPPTIRHRRLVASTLEGPLIVWMYVRT